MMETTMNDRLTLVDVYDHTIGEASKAEVHKKGLLHRAFSVFVLHDGKMLIQKRNTGKYHSGGLWTNACCSHPRIDEDLEEAVNRRINEELGFTADFHECFSFVYRHVFENGMIEYEYDHVFVSDYFGVVSPDPGEIEEYKWISCSELADQLLRNPDKFTVWFQIAAPQVLRYA